MADFRLLPALATGSTPSPLPALGHTGRRVGKDAPEGCAQTSEHATASISFSPPDNTGFHPTF